MTGHGRSDKAIPPRDGHHIAVELHTALRNAQAPPPYILVGAGFGGPLVRIFAGMYSDEVTGMVLIDPSQEKVQRDWDSVGGYRPALDRGACTSDGEIDCHAETLAQAHESPVPDGIAAFLFHSEWPSLFRSNPGNLTPSGKRNSGRRRPC